MFVFIVTIDKLVLVICNNSLFMYIIIWDRLFVWLFYF